MLVSFLGVGSAFLFDDDVAVSESDVVFTRRSGKAHSQFGLLKISSLFQFRTFASSNDTLGDDASRHGIGRASRRRTVLAFDWTVRPAPFRKGPLNPNHR